MGLTCKSFLVIIIIFLSSRLMGQPVPGEDENIPFLMTFGKEAKAHWGDDDFSQTFFFVIPENYAGAVYIRVYDPDVGGELDELNQEPNTKTNFSVYGGNLAYSHKDAQETDPIGEYRSGNLLASKTFGQSARYDQDWYTFGPFNPFEGEYVEKYQGYFFKIIAEGIEGDDGNLYRYFLSTDMNSNKSIEGAYALTFEYSFRMHNDPDQVSHIYPFVDDQTISIKQVNFDWDSDGFIRVVSVARQGDLNKVSADNEWKETIFDVFEEEKNSSLDIQFIKKRNPVVKNNNVVINVRNQYNELLPFNTIPIGGVPTYKPRITVREH